MIQNSMQRKPFRSLVGEEIALTGERSMHIGNDDCVFLVCPQQGVFSADVGGRNFVLHPSHVLVCPEINTCKLSSTDGVAHIVSLEKSVFRQQQHIRILMTSDLIRSLMKEVVSLNGSNRDIAYENAVLSLLVCEMARKNTVPDQVTVAMPQDKRLMRVCQELLKAPAVPDNMDDWCIKAGMSRRNFTRTFKVETGMTFGAWRREVRLVNALSLIIGGEQITSAAYEVGYESVSAFTVAFSRRFGVPPCHYKPKMREMAALMPSAGFAKHSLAQPCASILR
ncbi:helix-turn-helix domain-containing protein [Kordiimonas pumila]|uniref:Helix-turn-helix domain-containing protein n=1 Tax=Kordiimonas pumila TaxID=2161677 RepID=A0ABV7D4J2_9PROT|nr:AraC family transcriptional regulator [Kordiimonas pumila]